MTAARSCRPAAVATGLAVLFALPCPLAAARNPPIRPGQPAACIVSSYTGALRDLDPAKPESILAARDAALDRCAKAAVTDAEAVFREFRAFYDQVLQTQTRTAFPQTKAGSDVDRLLSRVCERMLLRCTPARIDAWLASTAPQDQQLKSTHAEGAALVRRYRSAGLGFAWSEGDWYAAPDPAFVLDVAGRLPLGDLGAWVTFWAAEAPTRVAEDAGIVIGWEGLRKRLARWDAFARARPDLRETQLEVVPHVAWLIAVYVFGIDNTPAYTMRLTDATDYDVRRNAPPPAGTRRSVTPAATLRIDPVLRSSYDRFLVENRESAYYTVIAGIVERLKASDGVPTKELVQFLRSELTDPYFANWLRIADGWTSGR